MKFKHDVKLNGRRLELPHLSLPWESWRNEETDGDDGMKTNVVTHAGYDPPVLIPGRAAKGSSRERVAGAETGYLHWLRHVAAFEL